MSVDSRTEQVLQDALRAAARKRTVLIVAHRLATVADSDRIVVLDGGRITAVGAHEELLSSSGLYRELATQPATRRLLTHGKARERRASWGPCRK